MKCFVKNEFLYVTEEQEVPADVEYLDDISSVSDLKKNIRQLMNNHKLERIMIPFSKEFLQDQNVLICTQNRSMSKTGSSVLCTYIPQQFTTNIISRYPEQNADVTLKNVLLVLDRPMNQHFEAYLFYQYYKKDINISISSDGKFDTDVEYDLVIHFGHATSEGLLIHNRELAIKNLKCKVLYSLGCYSADFYLTIAQSGNIDCFIGYTSTAFGQIPVNGSGRLFLYTMESCLCNGLDIVESVHEAIVRLRNDIGINDELNQKIIFYKDQQQALSIITMLNYIAVGNVKFKNTRKSLPEKFERISCNKSYAIDKDSVILIFHSIHAPDDMEIMVANQQGNQWVHKLSEINIYDNYIYKNILSAYYKTSTGFKYYVIINDFKNGNFRLSQDVERIYFYKS